MTEGVPERVEVVQNIKYFPFYSVRYFKASYREWSMADYREEVWFRARAERRAQEILRDGPPEEKPLEAWKKVFRK